MTRVLLCDDDECNRLTTSALLEEEGFQVVLASSFSEGHGELTAGSDYSLVILDQNLGDGLGTTLAALARQRLPAARVILLTGADEVDTNAVDLVLRKGESFDAVLAAVHSLVGRAG